jgi:hypothetical protein
MRVITLVPTDSEIVAAMREQQVVYDWGRRFRRPLVAATVPTNPRFNLDLFSTPRAPFPFGHDFAP